MSTVIIVGLPPDSMIGTESTDSIVTKARIRPTSIAPETCGRMISTRMRGPLAPRFFAASIVARSSEAMTPATRSATNGVSFQTNVTMMPRQSRRPDSWPESMSPSVSSVLFSIPFLARNVRMHCAATMNGMKSGQR